MPRLQQRLNVGMAEEVEQHHHEQEEESSGRDDASLHVRCYDEGAAVARLGVHHLRRWRQRCQSHGGEGVEDEVHPEHLRHGEGRFGAGEGAEEHRKAGGDVDRELEEYETLYVEV